MGDFFRSFLVFPEYWAFLFLAVPVGLFIGLITYKQRKAIQLWFGPEEYAFYMPSGKMMLRLGALIMLTIAMLGPYWGRREQEVPVRGREVYFLIDVSASMNCEDLQPSRLVKVKREVKKALGEMNGDRVGLIVFTADAYVQCPLTSDLNAASMFLDLIGTAQFSNNGTSFREALQTGLERFVENEDSNAVRDRLSRSMVLISDGEDFGDSYNSVVSRMRDHNISLFTVGVGTYAGGQVPIIRNGKKAGFKKTPEGNVAISQLKDETLKSLAQEFGTTYHTIDDQFDNLDPVLDQIKMLSSQELDREQRLAEVNGYQWFLGLGLMMFMASMFMLPYKPKDRKFE